MTGLKFLIAICICLSPIKAFAQHKPDSLEKRINQTTDLEEKLNLYYALIDYYIAFDIPKTIELSIDYLTFSELNKDKQNLAYAHSFLGEAYFLIDSLEQSLFHFQKQLKLNEKLRNKGGIASSSNNLGIVYAANKDYENAIKNYKKALKIHRESLNKIGISSCLNNIGVLYEKRKMYFEALDYYNQSYFIETELKNYEGISTSLLNIGSLQNILGNFKKAIQYSLESNKIADTLNLLHNKEINFETLFTAYKNLGNSNLALQYFEEFQKLKELRVNEEAKAEIAEINAQYQQEKNQQEIAYLNNQSRLQQIIILIAILALISTATSIIFLFRANKIKKRKNILLQNRNSEVLQQKEEITSQRDEIESQRNLAISQRDEIAKQKLHITDSINYAKYIQSNLLASENELKEILNNGFCYFKPLDIVSGDFFWLNKIENKTIIIAADCTGHGVPGAFMSIMGINFLNSVINEQQVMDPASILNEINAKIRKSFSHNTQSIDNFNGMDIAISIIDKEKMELSYACAKNKIIHISSNKLETLSGENKSIGRFIKDDFRYKSHKTSINKGDTFYMLSDGFTDQLGGPNKSKYKRTKLSEFLLNVHQKPMDLQKALFDKEYNDWAGETNPQIDDIMVIGFRID